MIVICEGGGASDWSNDPRPRLSRTNSIGRMDPARQEEQASKRARVRVGQGG